MKIFITGGSGFIGSHLADRLLARGDDVLIIDNFATGRRDNLKPHKNLKVIEGTIADEALVRLSGLNYISFRLANVYGPRNISGPLPTFFSRLTTGKTCFCVDTRRDFVYVDDLADVAMKAIDGQGPSGEYNVSSGSDVSIKELFDVTVKALEIKLDKEVEVRPRSADDAATILLDPSKTNREFGWSAKTTLEEGARNAIAYYREFGITETYTHLRLGKEGVHSGR